MSFVLIAIFVLGYSLITLEHKIHINKSWISLFMGALMWIIVSWGRDPDDLSHMLSHEGYEIFSLIMFLLGAMTIVEILGHYRFFSWLEHKLLSKNMTTKNLFQFLGAITFVGSGIVDNLTITLIMLAIGRRIFANSDNFLIFVINTVIAANAGGAFSPVGDVTTIMIWISGRFTAPEILMGAFLPAIACWLTSQTILLFSIKPESPRASEFKEDEPVHWMLVGVGLSTFGLAVVVNLCQLPPFIGIMVGLGLCGVIIDWKSRSGDMHYQSGQIVRLIQKTDLTTLHFFVGILLAVGALNFQGVLADLTQIIFGDQPQSSSLIIGHTSLGLISSILDNVPLTAAVLKMLPETIASTYWVLLAITVGTGGSVLVIGSAPGVAAMGQVPTLTFSNYLKKGTLPALVGYIAAVAVWYGQSVL